MPTNAYACPYCYKDKIKSKRGLTQHLAKSAPCKNRHLGKLQSQDDGYLFSQEFMEVTEVQRAKKPRHTVPAYNEVGIRNDKNIGDSNQETGLEDHLWADENENDEPDDEDFGQLPEDDEQTNKDEDNDGPDRTILAEFDQYTHRAWKFLPISLAERRAIGLLQVL